jgi:TnpA family transposase
VLDEILGNQADLPITEHATDTHGASLLNFALFDLCGLQLSPRIRDLGKITLYRTAPSGDVCAAYPLAGPLLTRRINTQLIADNWDEMLRLAASLKYGHLTASLIVAKLSRADRQNTLAAALKEYGALCRTLYVARYLSRPDYRRKIARQLNKGESTHALRRDIFYAHEGAIRRRHLQLQTEQAWCLTVAANAVTAWMTEYLGLALEHMRAQGRLVDETLLRHISPARSEPIGLVGTITVDIDAELARLDPTGHRPLRELPMDLAIG